MAHGCLSTHRAGSGYWYELGAHTCYNSYVGLTEVLDGCGLRGEVVPRAKTHMRMLDGDALLQGSNLGMLLRLFSWGELAVSVPRMFTAKKEGQTVYSYYAAVVGRKNPWERARAHAVPLAIRASTKPGCTSVTAIGSFSCGRRPRSSR